MNQNPSTKNHPYEIRGLEGNSSFYFISRHFTEACILVPPSLALEEARSALQFFSPEKEVLTYPAFETSFRPIREDPRRLWDRLYTQRKLSSTKGKNSFILTSLRAIHQKTLPLNDFVKSKIFIQKGEWQDRNQLIDHLQALGFQQIELVEDPGFFSVRGHLIDIFCPYPEEAFRLEFFGDEIVSIRRFDPQNQRSLEEIESIEIFPCRETLLSKEKLTQARSHLKDLGDSLRIDRDERERILWELENQRDVLESRWLLPAFYPKLETLHDYLKNDLSFIIINEKQSTEETHKAHLHETENYQDLNRLAYPPEQLNRPLNEISTREYHKLETSLSGDGQAYQVSSLEHLRSKMLREKSFSSLKPVLDDFSNQGLEVHFVFQSQKRKEALQESLDPEGILYHWEQGELFSGFSSKTFQKAFLNEKDIFGTKRKRRASRRSNAEDFLKQFSDLQIDDFIIHQDHGVARYKGLTTLQTDTVKTEFLLLEYADQDKLYVPVYRLDEISRYAGKNPKLDRLGSAQFKKRKQKAKKDILRIAHELIDIAAKRQLQKADHPSFDETLYQRFCANFEHELTSDQERAIGEVEADLQQAYPMDRLICGDVGFGKTEVAMRAAMIRLLQGKQVCLLAPTTLLVEQHARSFRERFQDFSIRIEHLSRFRTEKEQKHILNSLKKGEIQLIIGTHRLLQRDIEFQNLGLLVIDEEQRFGVRHKETIKKWRSEVDVISLSATPIPRTLQMSVAKVRELSLITTPPHEREPINTYVGLFDEKLIHDALERELKRGGQAIFIHNRVQTIEAFRERLEKFLPSCRTAIAHGQMKESELENIMLDFINQRVDLLISTSIVENGLDIPNLNTLFVDQSQNFGLSDLYQLRGRVGRSSRKSYAYFLIHEGVALSEEASKRLQVLQSCTELGEGFKVASHDLEIRGSGNLLGEEQSGVISEIGMELYHQMLSESIRELKEQSPKRALPEINSGFSAYIPEYYIPDAAVRISTYKRFHQVQDHQELLDLEDELLDRFGLYPAEVDHFAQLIRLRLMAGEVGATHLECYPGRMSLKIASDTPLVVDKLLQIVQIDRSNHRLDPQGKLTFSFASALKDPELLVGTKFETPVAYDFSQMRQFLEQLTNAVDSRESLGKKTTDSA